MNTLLNNKNTVKTLSWMIIAGVMITLCSYVETGMLRESIMAALWASIIKTPIYYLHERGAALLFTRLGATKPEVVTCARCLEAA